MRARLLIDRFVQTLSATLNASSSVSGSIEIQAGKKQSALCNSFYMFCTRESCHLSLIELVGKHTSTCRRLVL